MLNGSVLGDDLHAIDATVTAHAADPRRQMHAVIEVRVIGEVVDALPLDRLPRDPARPDRIEASGLGSDDRVATHAGLRRWDHRLSGGLHVGVAVPTVDPELTRVKAVRIGNRLLGRVAYVQEIRREVVGDHECRHSSARRGRDGCDEREIVERLGEYLHASLVLSDSCGRPYTK